MMMPNAYGVGDVVWTLYPEPADVVLLDKIELRKGTVMGMDGDVGEVQIILDGDLIALSLHPRIVDRAPGALLERAIADFTAMSEIYIMGVAHLKKISLLHDIKKPGRVIVEKMRC